VCDPVVPALSGLELTRRLGASPDTVSVPVIFVSDGPSERDVVRALEAGRLPADGRVRWWMPNGVSGCR